MTDKQMNKTTEALKLAEEALDEIHRGNMTPIADVKMCKAIAAIREVLAEIKPAPDGRIPKTVFTLDDISKAAEMGRQAGMIDALAELATVNESLTAQDHSAASGNMVPDHIAASGKVILTAEQARQIEVALLNWKAYVPLGKVALWDESDEQALSTIRAARAQEQAHLDDEAVDRFAAAMKAKLAKKRAEGRGGWEDKNQCSAEFLNRLLNEHVGKGDPVDVGNLAMMLWNRGERTEAIAHEQSEQKPVAWMVTSEGLDGTPKTYPLTGRFKDVCDMCDFGDPIPLYAAPVQQAEQKPIGYVIEDNDYEGSKIWAEPINGCCLPVYLAPVRTKDLTDFEIDCIRFNLESGKTWIDFARAVIAKFKEKNK
jgi:hypothetical protein